MTSTDYCLPRLWRRAIATLALAACTIPALAQEAGPTASDAATQAVRDRYPAGSITSLPQADQALDDLREVRTRLDALLTENRKACRNDFFMTACLLDARDEHRAALQKIKLIEVEANTYKRQARVDARDNALAARKKARDDAADKQSDMLLGNIAVTPEADSPGAASIEPASAVSPAVNAAEEAKKAQERARKAAAYRNKVARVQAKQREAAARKASAKAH